jgi:hypothetical protein
VKQQDRCAVIVAGMTVAAWTEIEITRDLSELTGSFTLRGLDFARLAAALGPRTTLRPCHSPPSGSACAHPYLASPVRMYRQRRGSSAVTCSGCACRAAGCAARAQAAAVGARPSPAAPASAVSFTKLNRDRPESRPTTTKAMAKA